MAVALHHDASPFRPDWKCLAVQNASAQQHLQSMRYHLCRLVAATLVYNSVVHDHDSIATNSWNATTASSAAACGHAALCECV